MANAAITEKLKIDEQILVSDKLICSVEKKKKSESAYFVVHKVIKQGIEIGRHLNHKNRRIDKITFGAPVEVNGVKGNTAVVVKTAGKNRYKAHRILTPEGKTIIFAAE
jgi:hypothetical protein